MRLSRTTEVTTVWERRREEGGSRPPRRRAPSGANTAGPTRSPGADSCPTGTYPGPDRPETDIWTGADTEKLPGGSSFQLTREARQKCQTPAFGA